MSVHKNRKQLDVKVRLLINTIDTHYRIAVDETKECNKRKKSVETIMKTYTNVVQPFIIDESKEFQEVINNKLVSTQNELSGAIDGNKGVEPKLNVVLEHLKYMLTTRKTRVDKIVEVLG